MEKLRIRPEERLTKEFPWQVFAVGWVAIAKAFAWLFSEISIQGRTGRILLAYYAIISAGFIVGAIGAWNLRKWGRNLLIALGLGDLAVYFFFNFYNILGLPQESWPVQLMMLISGPGGDLAILFLLLSALGVYIQAGSENRQNN